MLYIICTKSTKNYTLCLQGVTCQTTPCMGAVNLTHSHPNSSLNMFCHAPFAPYPLRQGRLQRPRLRLPLIISCWRAKACLKVMWVTPIHQPSWHFLAMESTLRYLICSSRLKVTLTALHCRYIRALCIFLWRQRCTSCIWMQRQKAVTIQRFLTNWTWERGADLEGNKQNHCSWAKK